MTEKHFAYKITFNTAPHVALQHDRMIDLLNEIIKQPAEGLFWIFRQFNDQPQEQLCIIDCQHQRIYYHYSGEVEDLKNAMARMCH